MIIKKHQNKEEIIAEYLVGNTSFRKLGIKFGIDFRTIHSWVMKYKGKSKKVSIKSKDKPVVTTGEPLPIDLKKLQAELRKSQLHVQLLNAIIDIGERELGVDIRKKYGAKR